MQAEMGVNLNPVNASSTPTKPAKLPVWMYLVAVAVGAVAGWLFWRTDTWLVAPQTRAPIYWQILVSSVIGLIGGFIFLCVMGVARWLYLGVPAEPPEERWPRP